MYLRITNKGVCPVEGFTVLGVSTARGNADSIGEFGSGNKHAVNVCLRNGINPIIHCGKQRLEFFTQPETMGSKSYNRVFVKEGVKKPYPLSISAEYGEKDWSSISMAMREFVSNAIDASGGDASCVKIEIVETVRAKEGHTVIGLPLTPEIQQWYAGINLMFLHFRPDWENTRGQRILPKVRPNRCCVYRKGVLVRAFDDKEPPSLYDYNFGEELHIDESRNLSEGSVRDNIAQFIAKSTESLPAIFEALGRGEKYFETCGLPEWELRHYGRQNKDGWQAAWAQVYGNAVVCLSGSVLAEMAQKKGYVVVSITESAWYSALVNSGILSVFDVIDNVNSKGDILRNPGKEEVDTLVRVWEWVCLAGLDNGKPMPGLLLFEQTMNAGCITKGYYRDGIVHIHNEDRLNVQTYLEEVVHYITGSGDCSRDFQDYCLRLCCKMAVLAGG